MPRDRGPRSRSERGDARATGRLAAAVEAGDFQYAMHQASGMVAAQLEVSVGQALTRLRGYAFGNDRPLTGVAQDVVARTLRFDDRNGERDPAP